jgi:hypothetical protein
MRAARERYAFETHCWLTSPPPRSRAIAGRATLMTELSIVTTAEPRIAVNNVSRCRCVMSFDEDLERPGLECLGRLAACERERERDASYSCRLEHETGRCHPILMR